MSERLVDQEMERKVMEVVEERVKARLLEYSQWKEAADAQRGTVTVGEPHIRPPGGISVTPWDGDPGKWSRFRMQVKAYLAACTPSMEWLVLSDDAGCRARCNGNDNALAKADQFLYSLLVTQTQGKASELLLLK